MPIVKSSYRPPWWFKNLHLQTIYPSGFRKIKDVKYQRERINTSDGDFLDLDWSNVSSNQLVIAIHGMESSSTSSYMLGIARALNKSGIDFVAMNLRGCSGEQNRAVGAYHSGRTDDIETTVSHVVKDNRYQEIFLVGFSLGGNMLLKYLGEQGDKINPLVKKAVAVSTPCHLESCTAEMDKKSNQFYLKIFLRSLCKKVQGKAKIRPGEIDDKNHDQIKTFKDFDDRYTAPNHGFKDALDYYRINSSKQFIPKIRIPTLLINAQDDPFLSSECYPKKEAKENPHFFLEAPRYGGHLGFIAFNSQREYWHESRIIEFIRS
jgi:uncharacterized protein